MFFALSILALVVTFLATRRVSLVWRILSVVLVVAAAAIVIWALDIPVRSEAAFYERTPVKQLIALVMLVAGMAAKYLYDLIEARRESSSRRAKLRWDWWNFAQPFLVSFIVFGAFWNLHGDEAVSVAWLVLSFQNGFFWQTILGKVKLKEG